MDFLTLGGSVGWILRPYRWLLTA